MSHRCRSRTETFITQWGLSVSSPFLNGLNGQRFGSRVYSIKSWSDRCVQRRRRAQFVDLGREMGSAILVC